MSRGNLEEFKKGALEVFKRQGFFVFHFFGEMYLKFNIL